MNKLKEAFSSNRHSTDADSSSHSNSNYTHNTSNTTPEMSPRGNRTSTSGPSVVDKASDTVFGSAANRTNSGHDSNSGSLSKINGPPGSAREAYANQKASGLTHGGASSERSSGLSGNSGTGLTDGGRFGPGSTGNSSSAGTGGVTGARDATNRSSGGSATGAGSALMGSNDSSSRSSTGTGVGAGAGTANASHAGSRLVDSNSAGTDSIGQAGQTDGELHAGRSTAVAQQDGIGAHTRGHNAKASPTDLNGEVHQDVQHLAHVTEETKQKHHIEEVLREKDLQSHHHHVQHHVQQVRDTEHTAEQHHEKVVPRTHIEEKHASTAKDAELLNSVANAHGHRDRIDYAPETRQIIDKGENITETVHHHVHNVIQPVIIKDSHEHHRHHTIIPSTHVAHHAPIIHESIVHDSISKADFLKSGGILGANLTGVHQAGVLNDGKCDRVVDGVAEQLEKELHLSPGQPQ